MTTSLLKFISCKTVPAFLALAMTFATTAGCDALRAGAARHQYIHEQTQAHIYHMPINMLWPNVRTMLFEQGYQSKTSDTGGSYSLETEPKFVSGESVRYLVQGTKIDENSCRIEFTKMSSSSTSQTTYRDVEMEWRLLQKVEPPAADEIKRSADAAGEAAKKSQ